ncbi:MAG: NAD(P)H-dependent oxidoreductase [Solirubrobacterales bacterium]|jgi:chromate reductase|nr:NAD(P)H-dependent oxidoreductase [Solirubrobacterales bacterium]
MTRILAISGSLRTDSWNTTLLRAAAELLPSGAELVLHEGLKAIPPFDEDDEHDPHGTVTLLRDAIARADAVLVATPEYNHSIPGQLKNALDWVSRPSATNALRGKPVAVVGTSTGLFGAVWAQAEVRKVVEAVGGKPLDRELPVGQAPQHFDDDGQLATPELREELSSILEELVAAATAQLPVAV